MVHARRLAATNGVAPIGSRQHRADGERRGQEAQAGGQLSRRRLRLEESRELLLKQFSPGRVASDRRSRPNSSSGIR